MRQLSELYTEVLCMFNTSISTCICKAISKAYLTSDERILVATNFRINRPHIDLHCKFAIHHTYINRDYWWDGSKEGRKQRIEFLEHLIKLHKANETITNPIWDTPKVF